MNKQQLDMLERAFAAEIDAAMCDQPIRSLVPGRSKIIRQLVSLGYLIEGEVTLGGRFPVTVRGYVLTERGRYAYCTSSRCTEAREEQQHG